MSETDLAIRTDDLTKLYGRTVGCERISLQVRRGHIFGFLGPNGAGKSTFIKLMVGLHAPTSGAGEILGRAIGDFRARTDIGFLPESFRYQEWLAPSEILAFHGRLLGMGRAQVAAATERVLAQVGLADHANQIATLQQGHAAALWTSGSPPFRPAASLLRRTDLGARPSGQG